MSFYSEKILPAYLNYTMSQKNKYRRDIIEQASGLVLEIGFGSGLNLPYYNGILKLIAIDTSIELYDMASNKVKEAKFPIEFINTSAETIPLPDNCIDTITCTWSLCSIQNPTIALNEMLRVLRPSGKFIFIEHGKSSTRGIAYLQNFLNNISVFLAGCHINRKMDTLIADAGFKICKMEKKLHGFSFLGCMYKGIAIKK